MQRPSPRFRSEEYSVYEISERNVLPKLNDDGAHLDGHQHGGRKPTKHLLPSFGTSA